MLQKPVQTTKRRLLFAVGCVLLPILLLLAPGGCGRTDNMPLTAIPVYDLPPDTLFITQGRLQYEYGALYLAIPVLDLFTAIGDSTDAVSLQSHPGLYEYSQLPAEGDVNVSIAGHRDIYGMEFYSLDKLQDGDFLYLLYQGQVYQYVFEQAKVVSPNDWSIILPQGFSCLTLTTCDPIGTTWRRLSVTGRLLAIHPDAENFPLVQTHRALP